MGVRGVPYAAQHSSPMAQSVARQAVNLQVAGSNPAGGDFTQYNNIIYYLMSYSSVSLCVQTVNTIIALFVFWAQN